MKKKNRNTLAKSSFIKQEMNRQNNMVRRMQRYQENRITLQQRQEELSAIRRLTVKL